MPPELVPPTLPLPGMPLVLPVPGVPGVVPVVASLGVVGTPAAVPLPLMPEGLPVVSLLIEPPVPVAPLLIPVDPDAPIPEVPPVPLLVVVSGVLDAALSSRPQPDTHNVSATAVAASHLLVMKPSVSECRKVHTVCTQSTYPAAACCCVSLGRANGRQMQRVHDVDRRSALLRLDDNQGIGVALRRG